MRTSRNLKTLILVAAAMALGADAPTSTKPGEYPKPKNYTTPGWSTVDTQPSYGGYGGGGGRYGYGGGWGGGGGTVAGNYLNGMASAIRAQGDYNLSTSQAMVNAEEAQRRDIENRQSWTQAYFEMRRTNAEYRSAERGPRGTPEDWVRYAKESAPARLSPGELDYITGSIAWPRLLQGKEFNTPREKLERLYAERSEKEGHIGPDTYQKILDQTNAVLAYLKNNIKKYPPSEYIEAKNFVQSLAYEARFTSG